MPYRNSKRFRLILSLGLLLLLTACFNDAPYADNYSHIGVWVEGPGHETMDTVLFGELVCTVALFCGYTNELQAMEIIPVVAVPDEGHEFTGWTRRWDSKWNQDLRDGANPLLLPADGDYFIIANFR
jgi:hypothetical protein